MNLNYVRHELLNLCRKSLSFWILWGKTLLCLIVVPLLFWERTIYGICSVPWLVVLNIQFIHVVTMMLYLLEYFELRFLSLVGLTVYGCYQIIQICVCRLIGGDGFLTVWSDLDWLLPTVVIYTTTGGGIIYLRCTVPLWSGFEILDGSLCIFIL